MNLIVRDVSDTSENMPICFKLLKLGMGHVSIELGKFSSSCFHKKAEGALSVQSGVDWVVAGTGGLSAWFSSCSIPICYRSVMWLVIKMSVYSIKVKLVELLSM